MIEQPRQSTSKISVILLFLRIDCDIHVYAGYAAISNYKVNFFIHYKCRLQYVYKVCSLTIHEHVSAYLIFKYSTMCMMVFIIFNLCSLI